MHLYMWHRQMGAQCCLAAKRDCLEAVVLLSILFSDSLPLRLHRGSSVWSPAAANKPKGDKSVGRSAC